MTSSGGSYVNASDGKEFGAMFSGEHVNEKSSFELRKPDDSVPSVPGAGAVLYFDARLPNSSPSSFLEPRELTLTMAAPAACGDVVALAMASWRCCPDQDHLCLSVQNQ